MARGPLCPTVMVIGSTGRLRIGRSVPESVLSVRIPGAYKFPFCSKHSHPVYCGDKSEVHTTMSPAALSAKLH